MLEFVTAGESHGPCLICVVTGLPAGVPVDVAGIDAELARRQQGYGRGGRMAIERDRVEVLSGVRQGRSIGSPVAMRIANRDNTIDALPPVTRPRPGHADLAGGLKYLTGDMRDVLERASARETAARVAAGALVKSLLGPFGIEVFGHVLAIGGVWSEVDFFADRAARDRSEMFCLDVEATAQMKDRVDQGRQAGDSVGGVVEVQVLGAPPGLGACDQWHRRLDARLAGVLMGIQAIKGVEVGDGFRTARRRGSAAHDEIEAGPGGLRRRTGRAGGTEGGMTTGEVLRVRAAMKPISTVPKALDTVDVATGEAAQAINQRSDVCAVPAAGVVAEAMVALVLADAALEKFGGDSVAETARNARSYLDYLAVR